MDKSIVELSMGYYEARPLPWRNWSWRPRGTKLEEEVEELIEALENWNSWREDSPNSLGTLTGSEKGLRLKGEIEDEIADVAITLAWIAHCHGIEIEDAIVAKTEKDRGRSVKDNITT